MYVNEVLKILKEIKLGTHFELNSYLFTDGILDSMDLIILVSELEKFFGIKISGDKIVYENFNTIPDIARLIQDCMEH